MPVINIFSSQAGAFGGLPGMAADVGVPLGSLDAFVSDAATSGIGPFSRHINPGIFYNNGGGAPNRTVQGGAGNTFDLRKVVGNDDEREILRRAVEELKLPANRKKRPESRMPSRTNIRAAVMKEYKAYTQQGGQLSTIDERKVDGLTDALFGEITQEVAEALRITGTMEMPERASRKAKRSPVASPPIARPPATLDPNIVLDNAEIERFYGHISDDVNAWISKLPENLRPAEPLFRQFIRNYVGFWLIEMEGSVPTRLTVSNKASSNAILMTLRDLKDAEFPPQFAEIAKGMVDHIASHGAWRERLAAPEAKPGEAVSRPAAARPIINESELAAQIGERLLAAYKKFFNDILEGRLESVRGSSVPERRDISLRWREAFIYITRFGVSNYGNDYNEAHIMANGLEPRLTSPLFRRMKDAKTYSDDVLLLMREFYLKEIGVNEAIVPQVAQLKPTFLHAEETARGGEESIFVPYDPQSIAEEGMASYVRGMDFMPFGDSVFKAEFLVATGITWGTFLRYGSLRRTAPRQMPKQVAEVLGADLDAEADTESETDSDSDEKDQEQWNKYVAESIENGHPEDVTVSPASEKAYLGILKTYRFLSERAWQYGKYIDVIDFIAAISPVMRRMREAATDGVIPIEIPAFMRSVPFGNIGQPTFARAIMAAGLLTHVKDGTFANWVSGKVKNPTYRQLRKNADSIASQRHGGRDDDEKLYNLQVLFRFMYVFDQYAPIVNPLGGRESFAPENHPARFMFRLVGDMSDYERGLAEFGAVGTHDEMVVKARAGYYDSLIENVRDYLLAIQRLPFGAELTFHGRVVAIDEYLSKLQELESRHLFDSSALKSQTSLLTVVRIEDIRYHYELLTDFARDAYFHLRVRNSPEGGCPILFDAAPRVKGYRYDSSRIGRVVLFIDDAEKVAQRCSWPEARKKALLMMRLVSGQLILEGAITREDALTAERLSVAARARWPLQEELFSQAVNDFIELEENARAVRLKDGTGGVTRKVGASAHTAFLGPVLPWWVPRWEEQFRIFAGRRGMEALDIERAERALANYFNHVKGFYTTFWGNTLRGSLEKQFGGAKDKMDEVFKLAKEFLPAVGTKMDDERGIATSGRMTRLEIERIAVHRYAAFFNLGNDLDEQLPIDDELLRDISNLLCLEYNEWERTLTVEGVRALLIEYNRGKSESPLAVAAAGGENVPVRSRVQGTAHVGVWQELVSHHIYSFVTFVRVRYVAPYFTDESLLEFATEYGREILTMPGIVEIVGMSVNAVGSAYAPYSDIEQKMARRYRVFLEEYLQELEKSFSSAVRDVKTALDMAAEGDIADISTPELLLDKALLLAGHRHDIGEIEKFNAVLGEIIWRGERVESVAAMAEDVFRRKVKPKLDEAKRREDELNAELDKKVSEVIAFRNEVSAFSIDQYMVGAASLEDEAACSLAVGAVVQGLGIITGLQGRIAAMSGAVRRAEDIALELESSRGAPLRAPEREGAEPLPYGTLSRAENLGPELKEAIAKLETSKKQLKENKTALQQRLVAIRRENDRRNAVAEAVTLESDIDRAVAAIGSLSGRLESEYSQPMAGLKARADNFVIDISSVETFREGVAAVNSIEDELRPVKIALGQIIRELKSIDVNPFVTRATPLRGRLDDAVQERLDGKVELLRSKRQGFNVSQEMVDDLTSFHTKVLARIIEAENRLPILPMSDVVWVKPAALPETDAMIVDKMEVKFSTVRPKHEYRDFIRGRLGKFVSCKVGSFVGYGSTIISPETASLITQWQQGDRTTHIEFDDFFGGKGKFKTGAGIRVIPLAEHDQMAKVVKAISFLAGEHCSESYLVAQVLGKREDTKTLAAYLFSTISNEPEAQNVDEARLLVRRWALAARALIIGKLGKNAENLFAYKLIAASGAVRGAGDASPRSGPSEMAKWWETEYGASYSEEEREESLDRANFEFDSALWGNAFIKFGDAERDNGEQVTNLLYLKVEPESYAAFMRGERDKVWVYNSNNNAIEEIDLRQLPEVGTITLDELRGRVRYYPPVADGPKALAMARLEQRIHTDPALRPLSWVINKFGHFSPAAKEGFYGYVWHILDENPDILEAQDRILMEYKHMFIDSIAEAPEVTKIPEGDVTKWFDRRAANLPIHKDKTYISTFTSAVEIIRGDPDVLNTYRMLMILSGTVFDSLSGEDKDFIRAEIFCIFDLLSPNPPPSFDWKDEFAKVKEFYLKHRAEVLKHRQKLEKMAQAIAPHQLLYPWDEAINRRFPEVGLVRAPLTGRSVNETIEGLFSGAVGGVPSLAEMLTLMRVANRLHYFSEASKAEFVKAMNYYASNVPRSANENERDRLDSSTKHRLIEIYEAARPHVIQMLKDIEDPAKRAEMQKEIGSYVDLSRLMKRERSWEPMPAGWEGQAPMARIAAAVPEYSMVRPEAIEIITGFSVPPHVLETQFPEILPFTAVTGFLPRGAVDKAARFIHASRSTIRGGGNLDREDWLKQFARHISDPLLVFRARKLLDLRLELDERTGRLVLGDAVIRSAIESDPSSQAFFIDVMNRLGAKPGQRLRDVLLEPPVVQGASTSLSAGFSHADGEHSVA